MADLDYSAVKQCGKCKLFLALAQYTKNKNRPDGLSWRCKICSKQYAKSYYEKDVEKNKASRRADYQADKDRYKERAARWSKENREKRKEISKKYERADPVRKRLKNRNHRLAKPGLYAAHYKMRQTRKRRAMPAWADEEAIKKIYVECAEISRATGVKHHVDHYYPLKSDVVCGLHNEYNLRIIPAFDNLSKGNSFPE